MITVATVCGDPGGANAIVPVIKLLEPETDVRLCNYAYNEGENVLHRSDIAFDVLPGTANKKQAINRLKETRATYVLSATSCNKVNWERAFLSAASQLEIQSLAVLDFWSNYKERFIGDQSSSLIMPNHLAVMDERARTEAIAAGLPASCLVVTGQPAFDVLASQREQFSAVIRRQLLDSIAVEEDELFVVFASQPLREMHEEYGAINQGFDETHVVPDVLEALEDITGEFGCRITFLVRPHPRERHASYERLESNHVRVLVSSGGDSREVVMAADLVVGMNSVLLFEACHLGCVVVSIQPGLQGADSLVTNGIGASHAVYESGLIRSGLATYLLDSQARNALRIQAARLGTTSGAARRVADLALDRMGMRNRPVTMVPAF